MSKIFQIWFGDQNLDIFWLISRDSVRIFQNRFLRWNRELKPVVLSTMNPINGTNKFLSYKGSCRILKRKSTQLKFRKFYFSQLILVLYINYHNNPHQHISICHFSVFQPALLRRDQLGGTKYRYSPYI